MARSCRPRAGEGASSQPYASSHTGKRALTSRACLPNIPALLARKNAHSPVARPVHELSAFATHLQLLPQPVNRSARGLDLDIMRPNHPTPPGSAGHTSRNPASHLHTCCRRRYTRCRCTAAQDSHSVSRCAVLWELRRNNVAPLKVPISTRFAAASRGRSRPAQGFPRALRPLGCSCRSRGRCSGPLLARYLRDLFAFIHACKFPAGQIPDERVQRDRLPPIAPSEILEESPRGEPRKN